MIRFVRACISTVLIAAPAFLLLQGCASLEPLPRFRASSTSFAPDQLPPSHRSASDLVDATTVGAYSLVKEEARQKRSIQRPADDVHQMIVNQSASTHTMHVDEIGLDVESLNDELEASEEFSEEEPPVDLGVIDRVRARTLAQAQAPRDETEEENPILNRVDMMKEIVNLLGVRYRYGGMDAINGLDCSAFVGTIYSRALGVSLPRSSNQQFGIGDKVSKNNLKIGDLVFFQTRRRRGPVSHVGIYVGESLFAHASSKHGVIISTLEEGYYARTFVSGRRIMNHGFTDATVR